MVKSLTQIVLINIDIPIIFGNLEISITNLTRTIFIALLIGIAMLYVFYIGRLIPRKSQLISRNLYVFLHIACKQITFDSVIICIIIRFINCDFLTICWPNFSSICNNYLYISFQLRLNIIHVFIK